MRKQWKWLDDLSKWRMTIFILGNLHLIVWRWMSNDSNVFPDKVKLVSTLIRHCGRAGGGGFSKTGGGRYKLI
jgi:hypothetical protein